MCGYEVFRERLYAFQGLVCGERTHGLFSYFRVRHGGVCQVLVVYGRGRVFNREQKASASPYGATAYHLVTFFTFLDARAFVKDFPSFFRAVVHLRRVALRVYRGSHALLEYHGAVLYALSQFRFVCGRYV